MKINIVFRRHIGVFSGLTFNWSEIDFWNQTQTLEFRIESFEINEKYTFGKHSNVHDCTAV